MSNARVVGLAAILFASVAGACSSSPSPKSSVTQSTRDNVTSMEIDATTATSALDLVNKLRPHWLRQGATASIGGGSIRNQVTLVYLDGNRLGTIDALRSITASSVRSMMWIPSTRAAILLPDIGSEPVAGVISIRTTI